MFIGGDRLVLLWANSNYNLCYVNGLLSSSFEVRTHSAFKSIQYNFKIAGTHSVTLSSVHLKWSSSHGEVENIILILLLLIAPQNFHFNSLFGHFVFCFVQPFYYSFHIDIDSRETRTRVRFISPAKSFINLFERKRVWTANTTINMPKQITDTHHTP